MFFSGHGVYTRWSKKRPKHLHALFNRVVEMNQHRSISVMTKHFGICVCLSRY